MNRDRATRPRVMIVEDDDDIRGAVAELLSDEGYAVDDFPSAEAGLSALRAQRYDAILTDEMLPGNPGSWMLACALSEGLLEATGVLVLSALSPPQVHPSHVHLTKPIDVNDLLAQTAACLRRAAGGAESVTAPAEVAGQDRAPMGARRSE